MSTAHVQQIVHSPPAMSANANTNNVINPAAVAHNVNILSSVHFLSACFSGAAAGILGLTNFSGFLLFFVSLLFSALCVSTFRCGGHPAQYLSDGGWELVKPTQDTVFGFILLWTLFYGIVHVYD
ncbi:hypothetical protein D9756_000104 [Leucocoprinus leucothites]|uniref:ER membrane protein complex subunit 6 n=1 Tax=Leucocoprinus leucothites TaxID=201217 RepID=A0A8H5GG66_9AGAR|nr:hypothetical protein D9756_000104 [Leucoagaricus leucothites]